MASIDGPSVTSSARFSLVLSDAAVVRDQSGSGRVSAAAASASPPPSPSAAASSPARGVSGYDDVLRARQIG